MDRFLGHLEPDDRELIQKYGGQCLLGRNLTQRILILDGVSSPQTAKSWVRLEGDRGAWERRISIVRYDRPYEGKKIPDAHRLLLETEATGILNFYIEGAQKLLREINELGDTVLAIVRKKE